jgi:hypothetical protein
MKTLGFGRALGFSVMRYRRDPGGARVQGRGPRGTVLAPAKGE